MTIEPAPDGWFIIRNNLSYHVNQEWLDQMFRHQVKPYGNNPAFNLLQHAFNTGVDATEFARRFEAFMGNRTQTQEITRRKRGNARDPEFAEFIRRQRANRR